MESLTDLLIDKIILYCAWIAINMLNVKYLLQL